jgi:hypothetical protein
MDKLIFVQDIQQDPATGELKQSTSSPDSINGIIFTYIIKLQHLPIFRWFFRSPIVLRQADPTAKQKAEGKK